MLIRKKVRKGFMVGLSAVLIAGSLIGFGGSKVEAASAVREVSIGNMSPAALLMDDGHVYTTGRASMGALGVDTNEANLYTPTKVEGLSNIVDVSTWNYNGAAVKSDGTVWFWGKNTHSQSGDGTTGNKTTPVQIDGIDGAISARISETALYIVKSDGTVWVVGKDFNGELGQGATKIVAATPTQIPGLSDVVDLQVGNQWVLALTSAGQVYSWGYNSNGQLGLGHRSTVTSPTLIPSLSDIRKITAKNYTAGALSNAGTVYMWGENLNAQVGDSTTTAKLVPTVIRYAAGATDLSTNGTTTFAIINGNLYGWGNRVTGLLETAGSGNILFPRRIYSSEFSGDAVKVTAGSAAAVTKRDGSVWTWGNTEVGLLMNGNSLPTVKPQQAITVGEYDSLPTSDSLSVSVDFYDQATVSWSPSSGSNSYVLLRNNRLVYEGTSTSFVDFGLAADSSYQYRLLYKNGTRFVGTDEQSVSTGSVSTVLGSVPVKSGDYVQWDNKNWRVISNNYLMYVGVDHSSTFDIDTSYPYFDVNRGNNIAAYVNTTFLQSMSLDARKLIKPHTWISKENYNGGIRNVSQSYIGLVDYKTEFVPYGLNNWGLLEGWTLTSNSGISATSMITTTGSTGYISSSNSLKVYPTVHLVPNVNVSGGAGTVIDPYVLDGASAAVPSPANFKAEMVGSSVKLSWDKVNEATGYKITRNDGKQLIVSELSSIDSDVLAGQSYTYSLVSLNGSVSSSAITTSITVSEIPLVAPTNLKVSTTTHNSVLLLWDMVPGASGYKVFRDGAEVGAPTGLVFNDTGLSQETQYSYSVVAVKGASSGPEATVIATTMKEVIPYPTGLSVTSATYEKVEFKWNPVVGADYYTFWRGNQQLGSTQATIYEDTTFAEGTSYNYGVKAHKGSLESETTIFPYTTPTKPIVGEAPGTPNGLSVTRAYPDRVKLQWPAVTDATYYDLVRDGGYLVYRGSLNAVVDETTGPEENYTYQVLAGNEYGKTAGNLVSVSTPAETPAIVIAPGQPIEGTITFNIKVVDGAHMYTVERNPEWTYLSNGDGTFKVTYFNTVTQETRDYGNVSPVNGHLPFFESGISPGQNYNYDVTAFRLSSTGTPEAIGESKVDITTPSDGSGVTVPGDIPGTTDPVDGGNSNPGNGGGTTEPDNGGATPNPDNGGTTPDPGADNGSTSPGTGSGNGGSSGGGKGSSSGDKDKGGTSGSGGGGSSSNTGKSDSSATVVSTVDESKERETNSPQSNESVNDSVHKFIDLPEAHFSFLAVSSLSSQGVVKGYSDGSFQPNKQISRAEFAIMLTRGMKYSDSGSYVPSFKDFNNNSWYAKELTVALNYGVTKGFDENTYKPHAIIPREQAAVMVANTMRKNGIHSGTIVKSFSDANSVIGWAKEDVNLSASNGIISGYDDGKFYPKKNITRAEAAVMIYKLQNLLNSK